MFHKAGTSTDQASESFVRKSDLRRLRNDFVHQFLSTANTSASLNVDEDEDEDAIQERSTTTTGIDCEQDEKEKDGPVAVTEEICSKVADEIFGGGSVSMKTFRQANVAIYTRTPNSTKDKVDGMSSLTNVWPYKDTVQPILIQLDIKSASMKKKKMRIVPSLQVLHFCMKHDPPMPDLIPIVEVHPPVSKFMCRGADLMSSGIAALRFRQYIVGNHFKVGRIVSVCVTGNPLPFAVGEVALENLMMSYGPGTKGVAVQIISCYGDDLWRNSFMIDGISANSSTPDLKYFGNKSYLDGIVVTRLDDEGGDDSKGRNNVQESLGGVPLTTSRSTNDENMRCENENSTSITTANKVPEKKNSSPNHDQQSHPEKIAVVNLYIIPQRISSKLNLKEEDVSAMNAKSDARRGTGFLTLKEAREILSTYIDQHDLTDQNVKSRVVIDNPLREVLWGSSKKDKQAGPKGSTPGPADEETKHISRKSIYECWLSKLEKGHAIVLMPGSVIKSMKRGPPPKVSIVVERRQGRKHVTRIRGLEPVSRSSHLRMVGIRKH